MRHTSHSRPHHNPSPHMPPYPHSQELFHLSLSLPCPHRTPHSPQITLASSHLFWLGFVLDLLLLARFASRIWFFWLSFLLAGSSGNSDFLHFCFYAANFSIFSTFEIFEKFSFWLVCVLSCSLHLVDILNCRWATTIGRRLPLSIMGSRRPHLQLAQLNYLRLSNLKNTPSL